MAKSDKTEKPTPKKRKDAREKGQIARSKDLTAALVFLTATTALGYTAVFFFSQLQGVILSFWKESLTVEMTPQVVQRLITSGVFTVMKLAAPLVLLTLAIGFGSSFVQGGLLISAEHLKPKMTGLNPKSNLGRVFSKQGLAQLVKSAVMIAVIAWLGYGAVSGFLKKFGAMSLMDPRASMALFGGFLFPLLIKVALFLMVLGIADYVFQKYKFEEDLKQTKEEVKEDFKQTEGNPLIKSRIRRLQREMARRRMMAAVPDADVVITNPTHFAVALQYKAEDMNAPLVLAKGQGPLALRIKQIAEENRIPLVENKPLAQALYRSAEVGVEIPGDLYKSVAEVLAYVYRLRQESWH